MKTFTRRLWLVFALLWLQRGVRLGLRAAWLLAGGILAGWGVHRLWGWLPDASHWLLLGAVPAGLSLLAIVLPLPHPARVAWRIDRLYGYQEQVSTAWQVRKQPPHGVVGLLAADASALLPRVFWRLLWRGWNLSGELVSVLIIAVLYVLVLGSSGDVIRAQPLQVERARLPRAGQDATAEELFPTGIPGLTPPTGVGQPAASIDAAGDRISSDQLDDGAGTRSPAGDEILRDLGAALAQDAATYEAGRALQDGDLEMAATQMELMGDQLERLDPESLQEAGEKLSDAGEALGASGSGSEQDLAQNLKDVGGSMAQGDAPPQEMLDAVAAALRALSELPIASPGATAAAGNPDGASLGGATAALGDPQPLERLTGEGGTLPVEPGTAGEGVLLQGEPDERGEQTVGGSSDRITGSETIVGGALTPYRFPWRWRYVVSEYFAPR